jgi:hypothetical protein
MQQKAELMGVALYSVLARLGDEVSEQPEELLLLGLGLG